MSKEESVDFSLDECNHKSIEIDVVDCTYILGKKSLKDMDQGQIDCACVFSIKNK